MADNVAQAIEWVAYAGMAPSADNNQPWMFKAFYDHIAVYLDSDSSDILGLISVGAAIENLSLVAATDGYSSLVEFVEDGPVNDNLQLVAKIRFESSGIRLNREVREAISNRRTNRGKYKRKLDKLPEVPTIPGVSLRWIRERDEIGDFAELVAKTDQRRIGQESFSHEFYKMISYLPDRHVDRINFETLQHPAIGKWIFKALSNCAISKILNCLGVPRLFALFNKSRVIESGAIGIIESGNSGPETAILVGRMLQAVWIQAELEGLAVQPMGTPTLDPRFSEGTILAFRIGYPRCNAVVSPKKPLNAILHSSPRYREAFSRNRGIVSKLEQLKLKDSRVAIAGMGGVGGGHLITLARQGIGRFTIADSDIFNVVNTNRQFGCACSTVGKNKAEVMAGMAMDINPEIDLRVFSEDITPENQDDFFTGVDVFIDAIDAFNFRARRHLFARAAELGIPVVSAGPVGFSTVWLIFDPDGMSFDEYFDFRDDMEDDEAFAAFIAGVAPAATHRSYVDVKDVDVGAKTGPSISSACFLAAGIVGIEVIKLLLGRGEVRFAPWYHQFDPYVFQLKSGYLARGNCSVKQRIKRWLILRLLRKMGRKSE